VAGACTCFGRPQVEGRASSRCGRCGGLVLAWVPEADADEAMAAGLVAHVEARGVHGMARCVRLGASEILADWFRRGDRVVAEAVVRDALTGRGK